MRDVVAAGLVAGREEPPADALLRGLAVQRVETVPVLSSQRADHGDRAVSQEHVRRGQRVVGGVLATTTVLVNSTTRRR